MIQDDIIQPVRKALEYYQDMQANMEKTEKQPKNGLKGTDEMNKQPKNGRKNSKGSIGERIATKVQ